MPETGATRQGLEHLADYISKGAGSAQVLAAMPASDTQQQSFRKLFDRSARYSELLKVVESLKVGFGIADPSALLRVLHKKRHDFEAISALDFFTSELQERARASLDEAEAAVHKLLFPAQSQASGVPDQPMRRRVWATRKPAWADRLACAWLIRRFADPEGSVVWLEKSQEVHADAVGFAYGGARFSNNETQVTFEVMLAAFRPGNERGPGQNRRHRALPRSARHAGAGSRRGANAAARRGARPATTNCSAKRRKPSTCSTKPILNHRTPSNQRLRASFCSSANSARSSLRRASTTEWS